MIIYSRPHTPEFVLQHIAFFVIAPVLHRATEQQQLLASLTTSGFRIECSVQITRPDRIRLNGSRSRRAGQELVTLGEIRNRTVTAVIFNT